MKTVLNEQQLSITLKRLAHQVLENHVDLKDTVLIGIQPRGIYVSDQVIAEIKTLLPAEKIQYGKLDITFYRDDIRKELHVPNHTEIPFSIENKNVVLIDDVLYTGRTIRAALMPCLILAVHQKWSYAFSLIADSAGNYPFNPTIPARQSIRSYRKK